MLKLFPFLRFFVFPKTKIVLYNIQGIGRAYNASSYPYKLEVERNHQDFHGVAALLQYGPTEHLIVVGTSVCALRRIMRVYKVRQKDSLLQYYKITGPKGVIEHFTPTPNN